MLAPINLRLIIVLVCLLPLLWLLVDTALGDLGGNPIESLHIRLGDWALRFLWVTLTITPLQSISGWRGMADYRQLFGLYAFFYATLHVLVYLVVDHALMWNMIIGDILESSYIWFGLLAYLIVLSLAITSPKWAKKRMGRQWKKLHRLIYFAAGAAMIHYLAQLKGNLAEPMFYLLLLSLLLGFRVLNWFKNRQINLLNIPRGRSVSSRETE